MSYYEVNLSLGEIKDNNSDSNNGNNNNDLNSNNSSNNNSNSQTHSSNNKSEENTIINNNTLGSYNLTNTEKYSLSKNAANILGKEPPLSSIIKSEAGIMAISTTGEIILQKTNGTMAVKEWILVEGTWYYLNPDNKKMTTGWQQTNDGTWYFMKPTNGEMMTGWIWVDQKYYYLDKNGACAINTITPDGYQVNENGVWIP